MPVCCLSVLSHSGTLAASGNAARAEGLLIAFSARRTLERGNDLGYLGDQLRLRFGDAEANAPFPSAVVVFRPVAFALKAWAPEAA